MNKDIWFIQNDRKRYQLTGTWDLLNKGGFGIPPIAWITKAGSTIGERVTSYRVMPRPVALSMYHQSEMHIGEWRKHRAELYDMLSPLYSDPANLILHRKEGGIRQLDIRYVTGAEMGIADPTQQMDFDVRADIQLLAHDPFFYDPTVQTITVTPSAGGFLRFPEEFPKQFSGAGLSVTSAELAYNGDGLWRTYPAITLTGKYSSCTIVNNYSGKRIKMKVSIADNDIRIITLGENTRSIVDASGLNRFGELDTDSEILDFFIEPNVTGQTITISFTGITDGVTGAVLSYKKRYTGI